MKKVGQKLFSLSRSSENTPMDRILNSGADISFQQGQSVLESAYKNNLVFLDPVDGDSESFAYRITKDPAYRTI